MNIDSYILTGFAILPKTSVVVDGVAMECVFNQSNHADDNVFGGFESDVQITLAIETSLLTNPRQLKGKLVVINDETYRVSDIKFGAIITHLTCLSNNAA